MRAVPTTGMITIPAAMAINNPIPGRLPRRMPRVSAATAFADNSTLRPSTCDNQRYLGVRKSRIDNDLPFLMYHGITEGISHANDQAGAVLGVRKSGSSQGPGRGRSRGTAR